MVENPPANAENIGSIPGSERSPGEGNGNPLQYSCLENPMDGEAWWSIVHRVANSGTGLSNLTFNIYIYLVSSSFMSVFHSAGYL